MEKNMQLKNRLNKLPRVNALLFLTLLVPSQQYAFANETQKALLTTLADKPKSAEIYTAKPKVMEKIKVISKEKLITKANLKKKGSIKKLGKTEIKAVLKELIVRKNISQRQAKAIQGARPQLNKLINKATSPIKEEILLLKG